MRASLRRHRPSLCGSPQFAHDRCGYDHPHQRILPLLTQKCERQPVRRQTEGCSVGSSFSSIDTSQRGLASSMSSNSIVSPHPQGHRIPTLQSSPSSLVRTRSRRESRSGSASPSTIRIRRAGPCLSQKRRNHLKIFMRVSSSCERSACSAAVPRRRARGGCCPRGRIRLPPYGPRRILQG